MSPSYQIWCSSGVTLRGGRTPDGGYIVEDLTHRRTPKESMPLEKSVDKIDFAHKVSTLLLQKFNTCKRFYEKI